MKLDTAEKMIDPGTGILLSPSYLGGVCIGNGDNPGHECCCDECDYYLVCFSDWNEPLSSSKHSNELAKTALCPGT